MEGQGGEEDIPDSTRERGEGRLNVKFHVWNLVSISLKYVCCFSEYV